MITILDGVFLLDLDRADQWTSGPSPSQQAPALSLETQAECTCLPGVMAGAPGDLPKSPGLPSQKRAPTQVS